jgi:AraC family transcriptional regulator of adaptative response/methylated-DNA-[protein]-cysteine methyltransferase
MSSQDKTDYTRIEVAIDYIKNNFRGQPDLDEIARQVHLSPFHFQRMFTEWAGVSPKKFLQYISLEHAKKILTGNVSLQETAFELGLSGTGRLHDLFVKIEGMTPGEYKNGGENLVINYSFAMTPFGNTIVAATPKGICYMAFVQEEADGFETLQRSFPNAMYRHLSDPMQQNALYLFTHDWSRLQEIRLHLKGTEFQLKVWEALLKIPVGDLTTYGGIAGQLGKPGASRAVGSAVGDNPVAYLIPCHRVIRSGGELGQYHWGASRKTAMIGWEAAYTAADKKTD